MSDGRLLSIPELRWLAEAAPKGQRHAGNWTVGLDIDGGDGGLVWEATINVPGHESAVAADAAYMAAANPTVVLALLGRLEAAERVVDAVRYNEAKHVPMRMCADAECSHGLCRVYRALDAYDAIAGKEPR